MNHVIDQIAAYGRNGDTELVHMSKGEVAGLRALAKAYGTKMTKNPKTGLDEAFNLNSLLPTLAGVALTVGSGGALSPLAAGLITGVGTTAITGDIKQGAMAGLGAFGGAGLAGGLSSAGGAAAAEAAGASGATGVAAPAGAAGTGVGAGTVTSGSIDAAGAAGSYGTPVATTTPGAAPITTVDVNSLARPSDLVTGAPAPVTSTGTATAAPVGETSGSYFDRVVKGTGDLMSSDKTERETAQKAFDASLGERTLGKYGTYAAAAAPVLSGFGAEPGEGPEEDKERYRGEVYRDRFGVQRSRAVPLYSTGGGIASLGKHVTGNGDGMSDDIRATIEGREPVMLSEGEYVIPAQAVSALGSGSTKAGVKQLDAMVKRIYAEQTGKPKQMKPMNPKKVMPA